MDSDFQADLQANVHDSLQSKQELHRLRQAQRRLSTNGITDSNRIGRLSKLIVLILFALTGNTTLPVIFLKRYKQRYHKISVCTEQLRIVVEIWILEVARLSKPHFVREFEAPGVGTSTTQNAGI